MDLVVYDETEYFRQSGDPLFDYPYTPRKTKLSTVTFVIPGSGKDYNFLSTQLKFHRSSVCLEGGIWDQFFFFRDIVDKLTALFGTEEKKSNANPEKDACASSFFEKIKFDSESKESVSLWSKYDRDMLADMDYEVFMELSMVQSPTKIISSRSTTQILDFLGDVGGFYGSLVLMLYLIGEYFSSHLLEASIASSFYLQKKATDQIVINESGTEDVEFEPI